MKKFLVFFLCTCNCFGYWSQPFSIAKNIIRNTCTCVNAEKEIGQIGCLFSALSIGGYLDKKLVSEKYQKYSPLATGLTSGVGLVSAFVAAKKNNTHNFYAYLGRTALALAGFFGYKYVSQEGRVIIPKKTDVDTCLERVDKSIGTLDKLVSQMDEPKQESVYLNKRHLFNLLYKIKNRTSIKCSGHKHNLKIDKKKRKNVYVKRKDLLDLFQEKKESVWVNSCYGPVVFALEK